MNIKHTKTMVSSLVFASGSSTLSQKLGSGLGAFGVLKKGTQIGPVHCVGYGYNICTVHMFQ